MDAERIPLNRSNWSARPKSHKISEDRIFELKEGREARAAS
jgi:hypothetical protein